jgi:hypothetical protein
MNEKSVAVAIEMHRGQNDDQETRAREEATRIMTAPCHR